MGYSNDSTDFENTDEPLTTRLIKCHQSQASSSSHGPLPSSSTRFHESSQGGPPHSRAKASRPSATWSNWRSLSSTKPLPLLGSQPCLGKPMRFEPTSEPTAKRWAIEPSCGTGPAPPVSVIAPKQGMNLVHLHLHLSMDHNHPEEIISLRPNRCLTATGILQSKPRSFRASSWSTRSGLGHRDSKICYCISLYQGLHRSLQPTSYEYRGLARALGRVFSRQTGEQNIDWKKKLKSFNRNWRQGQYKSEHPFPGCRQWDEFLLGERTFLFRS